MSREIRELAPRKGKTFCFYCCGPTVYGPAHIGNFRTFVLQDVFRRALQQEGLETFHVRNVTDVDDKTIRNSIAEGRSLEEFTNYWRDKFHRDCEDLNLLPPHREPGAVKHVPQQIRMIEGLVEKGHAYATEDGSVYFRVASFQNYGRLSRLDQRELKLGASGAISDDEYEKGEVADFALWKGRKPEDGDNYWKSPWGEGRPGWHLECSAMCLEYLGETFDLHSGGVDLVFPHHENEIAQSEACTGASMADHWFHLTHLLVDGGKMSKSLNNFYTLDDLKEAGFSPAEVRYTLISAHYRQPLNFVARDSDGNESFPALLAARQALEKIARFASELRERAGSESVVSSGPASFLGAFEALGNDLNTPEALGKIFSVFKTLKPSSLEPGLAAVELGGLNFVLEALGVILPELDSGEAVEAPEEILALARERSEARAGKDWAEADRLRDALTELGWAVKDSPDGFELTPIE